MQPWKYLLISFGSLFIEGPNQNVSFDNGCKQPDCLTICIMVTERLQVLLLREIKLQCWLGGERHGASENPGRAASENLEESGAAKRQGNYPKQANHIKYHTLYASFEHSIQISQLLRHAVTRVL